MTALMRAQMKRKIVKVSPEGAWVRLCRVRPRLTFALVSMSHKGSRHRRPWHGAQSNLRISFDWTIAERHVFTESQNNMGERVWKAGGKCDRAPPIQSSQRDVTESGPALLPWRHPLGSIRDRILSVPDISTHQHSPSDRQSVCRASREFS